jgi:hypothetical protein
MRYEKADTFGFVHYCLFSFVNCASTTTISNQQIQDLSEFGFPIIYNEPKIERNTGTHYVHIKYKNISTETITEIVFTFSIRDSGHNLNDSDTFKPNKSRTSRWWVPEYGVEDGFVTGIKVTFESGQIMEFKNEQALGKH